MNILPYKFFISAEKSTESSKHNALATLNLESELTSLGLSFVPVTGRYKDVKEESFMVVGNESTETLIHELASKYDQESYLVVDNENKCYFVRSKCIWNSNYFDDSGGQWTEVTKDEALKHDSSSEIDGRFFIIK